MADVDWNRVSFLESTANLEPLVAELTGQHPTDDAVREMTVCLQQGRLFFQSASRSPLEIRPLLLYYGTMAFAKAAILISGGGPLADLPPLHGLSAAADSDGRIERLTAAVRPDGIFHRFTDVIAARSRVHYFRQDGTWQSIPNRTASASMLRGRRIGLKDALSRIPALNKTYRRTFRESPGVEWIHLQVNGPTEWCMDVQEHDGLAGVETTHNDLARAVGRWRERFPILRTWRFVGAMIAGRSGTLSFESARMVDDEFDPAVLGKYDNRFQLIAQSEHVEARLSPLTGGLRPSDWQYLLQPLFEDCFVSDYALHYAGMFLLSSLVRYRPQTWVHAITRSVTATSPADDRALALIEEFMASHIHEIAGLVPDLLGVEP